MQFEIERKFLVLSLPEDLETKSNALLEQAYIFNEPETRIRRSDDKYFLTVKSKGDAIREEYEMEISGKVFEMFKNHLETPFLRKRRYDYPLDNGLVAEIDVYLDFKDLYTVDVEFKDFTVMQTFTPPAWFGPDISGHPLYRNRFLAMSLAKVATSKD